jgi:hypothetical protein
MVTIPIAACGAPVRSSGTKQSATPGRYVREYASALPGDVVKLPLPEEE